MTKIDLIKPVTRSTWVVIRSGNANRSITTNDYPIKGNCVSRQGSKLSYQPLTFDTRQEARVYARYMNYEEKKSWPTAKYLRGYFYVTKAEVTMTFLDKR